MRVIAGDAGLCCLKGVTGADCYKPLGLLFKDIFRSVVPPRPFPPLLYNVLIMQFVWKIVVETVIRKLLILSEHAVLIVDYLVGIGSLIVVFVFCFCGGGCFGCVCVCVCVCVCCLLYTSDAADDC